MENLISMTDFVSFQANQRDIDNWKCETDEYFNRCENFLNFIKKKPKLGYFVPCDENDKPLEEPIFSIVNYGASTESVKYYEIDKKRYQEAKQRVLFEGFEISYEDGAIFPFLGKYPIGFFSCENEWVWSDRFKTIEDLVEFNLKLTDTAKKEIGLI